MQRDVVVTLDMQPRSDESQRLSPFYLLLQEDKALERLHVIMLRNRDLMVSVTMQNGSSKKEHSAA